MNTNEPKRINPEFTKDFPVLKMTQEAIKEVKDKSINDTMEALQETAKIINGKLSQDRDAYISGMAVAFADHCGCGVEEIMLVEQHAGNNVNFWFQKRPGKIIPAKAMPVELKN